MVDKDPSRTLLAPGFSYNIWELQENTAIRGFIGNHQILPKCIHSGGNELAFL